MVDVNFLIELMVDNYGDISIYDYAVDKRVYFGSAKLCPIEYEFYDVLSFEALVGEDGFPYLEINIETEGN